LPQGFDAQHQPKSVAAEATFLMGAKNGHYLFDQIRINIFPCHDLQFRGGCIVTLFRLVNTYLVEKLIPPFSWNGFISFC